jgi:hypothetical protein
MFGENIQQLIIYTESDDKETDVKERNIQIMTNPKTTNKEAILA